MKVTRIKFNDTIEVSFGNDGVVHKVYFSYHDGWEVSEYPKLSFCLEESQSEGIYYILTGDLLKLSHFGVQLEALLKSGTPIQDLVGVEYEG